MTPLNKHGQIIFDSPAELASISKHAINSGAYFTNDESWTGETLADALKSTQEGSTKHVAAAEKLLEKITADLDLTRTEWQHDVAGAFPDVPAFLAGQPDCMVRRVQTISERAPLRVWVDVSSSGNIDVETLTQRGIAALALVMQLIRQGRAVELMTFTSLNGRTGNQSAICCRMVTAPIDIASVSYCLTSSGFSRALCYGLAKYFNKFDGTWSNNYIRSGTWKERLQGCKITLAGLAADNDIILPAPYGADKTSTEAHGLLFKNPAAWVNACLAQITPE
jgi:hypothetical protein